MNTRPEIIIAQVNSIIDACIALFAILVCVCAKAISSCSVSLGSTPSRRKLMHHTMHATKTMWWYHPARPESETI